MNIKKHNIQQIKVLAITNKYLIRTGLKKKKVHLAEKNAHLFYLKQNLNSLKYTQYDFLKAQS